MFSRVWRRACLSLSVQQRGVLVPQGLRVSSSQLDSPASRRPRLPQALMGKSDPLPYIGQSRASLAIASYVARRALQFPQSVDLVSQDLSPSIRPVPRSPHAVRRAPGSPEPPGDGHRPSGAVFGTPMLSSGLLGPSPSSGGVPGAPAPGDSSVGPCVLTKAPMAVA